MNETTTHAPKKLCPACHLRVPAIAETCTTIGCHYIFAKEVVTISPSLTVAVAA